MDVLAKCVFFVCFDKLCYLDAWIYGTDEKDVGEYDEDTDVDSQHDWGAAREDTENTVIVKHSGCLHI